MNLIKGQKYEASLLRVIGWTDGNGSGSDGYSLADYFATSGEYLGADANGIEPVVDGARVEAGTGDDYDTGRVESIDGAMALVAWDSGIKTPAPLSDLRAI